MKAALPLMVTLTVVAAVDNWGLVLVQMRAQKSGDDRWFSSHASFADWGASLQDLKEEEKHVQSWAFKASNDVESNATSADCSRPSGCQGENEIYATVDCDGDGILDHKCTTTLNKNMWLVLSTEGCPATWGRSNRALSECCPRPRAGCKDDIDIYESLDCDGDGILDHQCTTTSNKNMWLVLSSEGCPNSWGTSQRTSSECKVASPKRCSTYAANKGCGWTKEYSCQGQTPGHKGIAEDDGSFGYDCCCNQGLWKELGQGVASKETRKESKVQVLESTKECVEYMTNEGCSWTKQWSCQGQALGSQGAAEEDGTVGYNCCCNQGLWSLHVQALVPKEADVFNESGVIEDAEPKADVFNESGGIDDAEPSWLNAGNIASVEGKCIDYISKEGCSWTKQWSCEGQTLGSQGQAEEDGTTGYDCCCNQGLWRN